MNFENRDDFMWLCLGLGSIAGATAAHYVPYLGILLASLVTITLGPMVRRWATAHYQQATASAAR